MPEQPETVAINMDGKALLVEKGLTILQVAQQNNVYIPTLCAHKDLSPFGGCRLCIVEVEGKRGFATACTTPADKGMIIRTRTAAIRSQRIEVLQLLLSEHPSSCLVCDEKDECKDYSSTIRKSGVTTGCRYCPNDGQCELQDIVEKVGVTEINSPIHYRNLRVEKEDPFYDRDYNLCVLCGRCVRACQEVRGVNLLAFKQRGRATLVGPAFDRTHLEAGCEFCGACVSVCPSGALSEKIRKWDGKPDHEQATTCGLCGVGCQINILAKNGEVIGGLPANSNQGRGRQLCVKGRFCIPELVTNHERLRRPYRMADVGKLFISVEEAVAVAAEKLSQCPPENFAMLVSADATNEDLYIAQKFTRTVMGSHAIDTSSRTFYGPGLEAYLKLFEMAVPLTEVQNASAVVCVGLDTQFGRSTVGVEVRRALKEGAKLVSINSRHHNLDVIADKWLKPKFGAEADLLNSLVDLTSSTQAKVELKEDGQDPEELRTVAEMLKQAASPVILVGSDFVNNSQAGQIFEAIRKLAKNIGAGILPLPAQNNLVGSILMGAYPELLPGGLSSADSDKVRNLKALWGLDIPESKSRWNADSLATASDLKVLYLIGAIPRKQTPRSDFLIYQNSYPADSILAPDLVLPSATFTEVDGTFINGEGRIQLVRKAVNSPGEAMPDWELLCLIAKKMGKAGFDFTSVEEIDSEISRVVQGFEIPDGPDRKVLPIKIEGELVKTSNDFSGSDTDSDRPFYLDISINEHSYRGFPISLWAKGLKDLLPDNRLAVSPEDAEKLGVVDGDELVVTAAEFEKSWAIQVMKHQPQGILHVRLNEGEIVRPAPCPVRIRKKDV
ncbi:MAG: molybdopterin-dependent oxidoreductase [Desulfomonilaceae bacterium]